MGAIKDLLYDLQNNSDNIHANGTALADLLQTAVHELLAGTWSPDSADRIFDLISIIEDHLDSTRRLVETFVDLSLDDEDE